MDRISPLLIMSADGGWCNVIDAGYNAVWNDMMKTKTEPLMR